MEPNLKMHKKQCRQKSKKNKKSSWKTEEENDFS